MEILMTRTVITLSYDDSDTNNRVILLKVKDKLFPYLLAMNCAIPLIEHPILLFLSITRLVSAQCVFPAYTPLIIGYYDGEVSGCSDDGVVVPSVTVLA